MTGQQVCLKAPPLTVDAVSFSYRVSQSFLRSADRQVLKDVTFSVRAGETLGIVGSNGSGKTTLLRLLAGVLSPNKGVISIDGAARVKLLSLGLGFLSDLTGADNVFLNLMLQGFSYAEARASLAAVRDFSELGAAFDEKVKTYSSGMRSRLTFSAAILGGADILLVDEVLSVGDGSFREKALGAMNDMLQSNQTVVFVSHSDRALSRVCDRVIWLEKGSIRQVGEPLNVLENYRKSLLKVEDK